MLAWVWPIEFEHGWWLSAALAVPLLVLLSRRSLAGLEPVQRRCAMGLRSAVWLAVVAALAGATYLRENKTLSVLFVLDRSRSIPDELLKQQDVYIRAACETMPPEDRVGVVSFAGQANIEQLPSRGGIHFDEFPPPPDPERTNVSQAVKMALATFPQDTAKRIVLLSDGNENVGDALGDAEAAAAAGVALDVRPMRYSHRNEVFVDRMVVPAQAYQDEEVPIRLSIRSRRPTSGRIEFYHDGRPVDLRGHPDQPSASGRKAEIPWGENFSDSLPRSRDDLFFHSRPESAEAPRLEESQGRELGNPGKRPGTLRELLGLLHRGCHGVRHRHTGQQPRFDAQPLGAVRPRLQCGNLRRLVDQAHRRFSENLRRGR